MKRRKKFWTLSGGTRLTKPHKWHVKAKKENNAADNWQWNPIQLITQSRRELFFPAVPTMATMCIVSRSILFSAQQLQFHIMQFHIIFRAIYLDGSELIIYVTILSCLRLKPLKTYYFINLSQSPTSSPSSPSRVAFCGRNQSAAVITSVRPSCQCAQL